MEFFGKVNAWDKLSERANQFVAPLNEVQIERLGILINKRKVEGKAMKINNPKIEKIKMLENRLNNYTVYLNKKGYAWPGIGYFFDENDSKWKVFDTHEKGDLTYSYIAESEDEVIDKLLKVLEVEYDAQQVIIKLRKRNRLSEQ